MHSSAEVERLTPATTARMAPGLQAPRRLAIWLAGLPEHLGAAIVITALFAAAVLGIAAAFGAPLVVPRERVSVALGRNAALPVLFAIALYTSLRVFKILTGKQDPKAPPLLQVIAVDMTLMGLFLVVTYFHFSLKTWIQVINPHLYDDAYMAIDRQFQPVIEAFYWVREHVLSHMPNADAWYQAAFLLMFITGFCSLAITRNPIYPQFCIGVLLTLCIGGLSYMIAPALGPFIFEDGVNPHATEAQAGMYWAHKQAVQHGMAWIEEAGPAYFTGGLAAMPSLHIAHAICMTYFIKRAGSPLFVLFLFICFWVMIESVTSRWHYLIDLPAGLLISAVVIWLTTWICGARRRSRTARLTGA